MGLAPLSLDKAIEGALGDFARKDYPGRFAIAGLTQSSERTEKAFLRTLREKTMVNGCCWRFHAKLGKILKKPFADFTRKDFLD